jgi:hypothetical protein
MKIPVGKEWEPYFPVNAINAETNNEKIIMIICETGFRWLRTL